MATKSVAPAKAVGGCSPASARNTVALASLVGSKVKGGEHRAAMHAHRFDEARLPEIAALVFRCIGEKADAAMAELAQRVADHVASASKLADWTLSISSIGRG